MRKLLLEFLLFGETVYLNAVCSAGLGENFALELPAVIRALWKCNLVKIFMQFLFISRVSQWLKR